MEENEIGVEKLLPQFEEKQQHLIGELLKEDDVEKARNLTHLFNMHQTKRQVIRLNALNDIQDALVKQMLDRLNKTPDNFDNADIANWMKVTQQAIVTSQQTAGQINDIPTITYQQNNQININSVDSLSKESRDKISEVLKSILQSSDKVVDLDDSDTVYDDVSTEIKNEEGDN